MQGIGWCTMEDLKWNEKGVYLMQPHLQNSGIAICRRLEIE